MHLPRVQSLLGSPQGVMAVMNNGSSVFLALSGGLLLAASDIKVANAMIDEGMASVGMALFSAHPS